MMDKIEKQEIVNRLAEIRRSHHYTQEQLAEALNLTPKHISHCESGSLSISLKTLIHFCNLFNCSMDYIIWGKSKDEKLEQLNDTVPTLLRTGTKEEINLLNRYLDLYSELLNFNKK